VREATAAARAAGAVAPVPDRLAPLATTGVGSLPHDDPAAAVRHALAAYDLPFCPQLPRREGDMVHEWLGGDPAGCGWAPDRDRERPAAWDAFTAALAQKPPAHGFVKLQVTGPATLAAALDGPGDEGLARELATWLAANAGGQVRRLADMGLRVVLVVDEPGLACSAIADPAVYDPLRATGAAVWGLHVCGPVPWPFVDALEPGLVSFDLTRHGLDPVGRSVLGRLIDRGGRIAWGALDPVAPGGAPVAAARLGAEIASLGQPEKRVAERSLVSPGCGTGMLTEDREEGLAAALRSAAAAMRSPRFMREQ
jgi:hypothetical protein